MDFKTVVVRDFVVRDFFEKFAGGSKYLKHPSTIKSPKFDQK